MVLLSKAVAVEGDLRKLGREGNPDPMELKERPGATGRGRRCAVPHTGRSDAIETRLGDVNAFRPLRESAYLFFSCSLQGPRGPSRQPCASPPLWRSGVPYNRCQTDPAARTRTGFAGARATGGSWKPALRFRTSLRFTTLKQT
jgi:hypothetical protein